MTFSGYTLSKNIIRKRHLGEECGEETLQVEVRRMNLMLRLLNGNDKVREALVGMQAHTSDQKYAIKASGHGSGYRFDGLRRDRPSFPLLTLEDAIWRAHHWVRTADTIGGRAVIYNEETGETISDWRELPEYEPMLAEYMRKRNERLDRT